jgi:uncharacterized protein YjbJ (UPF0337 family)
VITVYDNFRYEEPTMNREQVKGSWDRLKGKAKVVLGELTDNEGMKAEGTADKLYGLIQKRFGDTKEVIKAKIDKVRLP